MQWHWAINQLASGVRMKQWATYYRIDSSCPKCNIAHYVREACIFIPFTDPKSLLDQYCLKGRFAFENMYWPFGNVSYLVRELDARLREM